MGTPGPTPTNTLGDTLEVFARLDDPCTPLTAAEVADELGCARRTAFTKLRALAERGDLKSKKVGARGRVWWRPHAHGSTGFDGQPRSERAQFESFVRAVADYAIFTLDPDGTVASWNEGARRIKGYDEDEIVGEHFSVFYTDEDVEQGIPERNLADAAEHGRTEDEGWRRRKDGSRFRANVVITAVRDDDGELEGFTKVTQDVTERRERELLYEAVFNGTFQFTGIMEPDGTLIEANDTALSFGGLDRDDVVGKPVWETYWWQTPQADRDRLKDAVERAADGEFVRYEVDVRGDDRIATIDFSIRPITDEHGDVEFLIPEGRDITGRKEREEALRRERDLLDEVLETSPVGIAVVDSTGGLVRANTRAEEILGAGGDDPEGYAVSDRNVYDEDGRALPHEDRPSGRALRTGETVIDEHVQVEYPGGERVWLSVNASPIRNADGEVEHVVLAAEDITRLKEQARRLERQRDDLEAELDEVFDRVTDAFYALDDEWRFTHVNKRAEEIIQRSEAEMLGESIWEEFPAAAEGIVRERFHEAMETQEPVSFELFYEPLDVWAEVTAYPSETGLSVYFRDVTDRVERERALEESELRYRTLAKHFPNGVVSLYDHDLRYTLAAGQAFDDLDLSPDDLKGHTPRDVYDDAVADAIEPAYRAALGGDTTSVEVEYGGREWIVYTAPIADGDGDVGAGLAMAQDITERKQRERELAEQRERYYGLVEAAPVAIAIFGVDGRLRYVNDAGVELAGADSAADLVGEPALEFVHPDDRAEATDRVRQVIEERETTPPKETKIVGVDGRDDVKHTILTSVPITYEGEPASQTVLADITEQKERERRLARQREQLAALNRLNGVVQDITHAVIESSTRDDIEERVCERLVAPESYRVAWIGTVDREDDRVCMQTGAGVGEYLDEVPVATDDGSVDRGPTARAARTGERHVARHLGDRSNDGPWLEHALGHGVRSMAAIPIEYGDSLYGVLTVGSERPDAFGEDERTIIGRLGRVVGHAITAIERKRALISEDVVELRFHVRNVFDTLEVPAPTEGTITFDRVVPAGGDTFLVYGTVTEDTTGALDALAERLPHFEEVDLLDGERFELTVSEPPAISVIASYGGRIESAVIDDGDYDMTVHVPHGTDVRELVETVRDVYPDAEIVAQRRTIRTDRSVQRVETVLNEGLTERQRMALEASFFAGFFDWPRSSKGEEIAESLGISPSTFHQHVRTGERKLMRALFEDGSDAG